MQMQINQLHEDPQTEFVLNEVNRSGSGEMKPEQVDDASNLLTHNFVNESLNSNENANTTGQIPDKVDLSFSTVYLNEKANVDEPKIFHEPPRTKDELSEVNGDESLEETETEDELSHEDDEEENVLHVEKETEQLAEEVHELEDETESEEEDDDDEDEDDDDEDEDDDEDVEEEDEDDDEDEDVEEEEEEKLKEKDVPLVSTDIDDNKVFQLHSEHNEKVIISKDPELLNESTTQTTNVFPSVTPSFLRGPDFVETNTAPMHTEETATYNTSENQFKEVTLDTEHSKINLPTQNYTGTYTSYTTPAITQTTYTTPPTTTTLPTTYTTQLSNSSSKHTAPVGSLAAIVASMNNQKGTRGPITSTRTVVHSANKSYVSTQTTPGQNYRLVSVTQYPSSVKLLGSQTTISSPTEKVVRQSSIPNADSGYMQIISSNSYISRIGAEYPQLVRRHESGSVVSDKINQDPAPTLVPPAISSAITDFTDPTQTPVTVDFTSQQRTGGGKAKLWACGC